jgi:hypothetical protein
MSELRPSYLQRETRNVCMEETASAVSVKKLCEDDHFEVVVSVSYNCDRVFVES